VLGNREWQLLPMDVGALLTGLRIMGTGGGGSVEFGRTIIENDLKHGRTYQHVRLGDVPDGAWVASGGIMGSVKVLEQFSPAEIVDRWEERFEPLLALRALENYLGRKIDFVVPFELGGLNTPVIQSLAARAGIPVIDGDGVGRSAPETQMTSFIGHGVSVTPMPLADAEGNIILVTEATTPFVPDEIGRFVITRGGGQGANAHYPMDGRTARRAIIPDSISMALELGRSVNDLQDAKEIADAVAASLGGQIVFSGEVMSLEEQDAMGFLVQNALLEGRGASRGDTMDVLIKNEFMLATLNGEVGCVFPDLILLIDEQGRGVMSADLSIGDQVRVIVAPCHPRLREAVADEVGRIALGPARFGRPDLSFSPVEELSTTWGLSWEGR